CHPELPICVIPTGIETPAKREFRWSGGTLRGSGAAGLYVKEIDSPASVYPSIIAYPATCLRPVRFQYKYPGTPTSTIAVPQKASVGRVMMVFSVHAAPIRM